MFTSQQNHISLQLSQRQYDIDIQLANDQQRETTLKTYLDDMSDLLLNHHLRQSKSGEEVNRVARERTLTTLRRLDAPRNRIVQHLDDFKSKFPDIPVAVTEFGVKHSCMKSDDFLQQQLDVLESSGCNHALWVWGDDSDNFDVRNPSLTPTIATNWEKNTTFYS